MSLTQPKRVILDMDSATAERTSESQVGTRIYLAPEMTTWFEWDERSAKPPRYDRSVDIWALSPSIVALSAQRGWTWDWYKPNEARGRGASLVTPKSHTMKQCVHRIGTWA